VVATVTSHVRDRPQIIIINNNIIIMPTSTKPLARNTATYVNLC